MQQCTPQALLCNSGCAHRVCLDCYNRYYLQRTGRCCFPGCPQEALSGDSMFWCRDSQPGSGIVPGQRPPAPIVSNAFTNSPGGYNAPNNAFPLAAAAFNNQNLHAQQTYTQPVSPLADGYRPQAVLTDYYGNQQQSPHGTQYSPPVHAYSLPTTEGTPLQMNTASASAWARDHEHYHGHGTVSNPYPLHQAGFGGPEQHYAGQESSTVPDDQADTSHPYPNAIRPTPAVHFGECSWGSGQEILP